MCDLDKAENRAALGQAQDKAPIDPWAGRATGMRCRTCMFFVAESDLNLLKMPVPGLNGAQGRCRRMSGFPVVFEADWCGDHKLA